MCAVCNRHVWSFWYLLGLVCLQYRHRPWELFLCSIPPAQRRRWGINSWWSLRPRSPKPWSHICPNRHALCHVRNIRNSCGAGPLNLAIVISEAMTWSEKIRKGREVWKVEMIEETLLVGGLEHFFHIGNNHLNWRQFSRGIETTNQWGNIEYEILETRIYLFGGSCYAWSANIVASTWTSICLGMFVSFHLSYYLPVTWY